MGAVHQPELTWNTENNSREQAGRGGYERKLEPRAGGTFWLKNSVQAVRGRDSAACLCSWRGGEQAVSREETLPQFPAMPQVKGLGMLVAGEAFLSSASCHYRSPAGQGMCGQGQPWLQEGIRANPLGFSPTHEP